MPTDPLAPPNSIVPPPTDPSTRPLPANTPIPPVANYTPAQGTAVTATPVATPVPAEGLVQNRIKSLIDEDSPLMQQSKAIAADKMNERGLLNSSLNTTAGQQAVIAAALPIAQQDATAYNQAAINTANAGNTAANANASLLTSMNTTNANAINAQLNVEAQAANARSLALIDNNTKQNLALLQSQNQVLLQTNVNAANMFTQVTKAIADIATNTTLDDAAKKAATNSQLNLLNEGLRATGTISGTDQAAISSLNLGQFFSTTPPNTGATGVINPPPAGGTTPVQPGVVNTPPVPNGGTGNFTAPPATSTTPPAPGQPGSVYASGPPPLNGQSPDVTLSGGRRIHWTGSQWVYA